jgi:hypothetical protein
MFQSVLKLVAAAADELLWGGERDFVVGFYGIAGLVRGVAVDFDLASHHCALGFFAAVAKAAFDERLVKAKQCHGNGDCWTVGIGSDGFDPSGIPSIR